MLPKYKAWSPSRRMDEAVRLVMEGAYNQTEAAKLCGVSRSRVNTRFKTAKQRADEVAQRSAAARAERAGLPEAPAPERPAGYSPVNERRRVPPLAEFNELYFNNVLCSDCGDTRHETPFFHTEMMTAMDDPSIKRLLVNLPPFHAKSTVSVRATLHDIVKDPNSRTAFISKARGLSISFLYQIRRYLEDRNLYEGATRNLVDDYGPFFDGTTQASKTELYVAGRTSGEKDPTVQAFGIGTQIYGRRWDKARLDDVFDMANSKNPEQVTFNLKWITSEVESRVGKSGSVTIVGTRVGPQDGYRHLQTLPGYHVIRYPAIIDELSGQTLWPEHFDLDAAKLKRGTMTPEDWQLLYQNAETLGEGASFTPEMLENCHDQTRFLSQVDSPALAGVIGLDPAGGNKQSGFTALVLLAVDLNSGVRYLIDVVNAGQMKAPQLMAQLFAWADQYSGMLRELRVESNGLQSQLVQYNNEILQKMTQKGIRVVPHITSKYNKWDPQFGVESLSPMFYNRQIVLPWGDINARRIVGHLEQQLLSFPLGNPTDLYMALWFAELGCRELFDRHKLPLYGAKMKVPRRIQRKRRVLDFGASRHRSPTQLESAGWDSSFVDTHPAGQDPRYVNVLGE